MLFLFTIVLVLLGSAWLALPAGFLTAVSPLILLSLAGTLLILPTALIFRLHERWLDLETYSRLSSNTASWLRAKLDALSLQGITIATNDEHGSAFHPSSNTILLRERVHGEHTVRARAIAAHELGHAELHTTQKILSRVLLWCRTHTGRFYWLSVSLLIGCTMISVPWLLSLSWYIFLVAVICVLGVLLDEAHASIRALLHIKHDKELTRRHFLGSAIILFLAFTTYLAYAATIALPLFIWPAITQHIGDGVLAHAAPSLAGWKHWVALVSSIILSIGAIGAYRFILHEDSTPKHASSALASAFSLLALFLKPLFVFLVCDQPQVISHPWVIVLGVASVWNMTSLPVLGPIWLISKKLGDKIDLVAKPSKFLRDTELVSMRAASEEHASVETLKQHERESLVDHLWTWHSFLLLLPIWRLTSISCSSWAAPKPPFARAYRHVTHLHQKVALATSKRHPLPK